ncbi:MAG: FHA domain-containing protein, partial [Thermoguttaceae bacterium]|nr:FHA domain-containing protein [Thermoguttaceae bacterium]
NMKVQLKVVGGAKAGQLITINSPQFMIGRADDCHLKPRSELISRYHCIIISETGYIAIRDLGSKNGVYLNGERVALEQELKNGDRLIIGPLEFEVILSVTLKGENKPKVESISEVVSRAVEQSSLAAAKTSKTESAMPAASSENKESEEDAGIADWLLDDDDNEIPEETKTIQLPPRQYVPDTVEAESKPAEEEKKEKPAKQKTSPLPNPGQAKGDASSSDAAANLLKNFFRGSR